MTKKKDRRPVPELDSPTAAYPIGTFGGSAPREAGPPSAPSEGPTDPDADEEDGLAGSDMEDDEEEWIEVPDDEAEDSDEYETATFWVSGSGGVHPAFLVLSLIGGGAIALAVVAVIGMFLLLG